MRIERFVWLLKSVFFYNYNLNKFSLNVIIKLYIYYALYKVVVYELRGVIIYILVWSLISL